MFKYFANLSKFNARCESPMAIFRAETVPQPPSLNCQPCLKPVPWWMCCKNCFNLNWPGMSVVFYDSRAVRALTGFVSAREGIPIPPTFFAGGSSDVCPFLFAGCCPGVLFFQYTKSGTFIGQSELNLTFSVPQQSYNVVTDPIYFHVTAEYAYETNRTFADVFSPWNCSGGTFHLVAGQPATSTIKDIFSTPGTDIPLAKITWPTTLEIVGVSDCTEEHKMCGLDRPDCCTSSTWGYPGCTF